MSKRGQTAHARIPRDLYRTFDPRAGEALRPFLAPRTEFIEPCAGAGDLIRQLERLGHICVGASDIHPLAPGIQRGDARRLKRLPFGSKIITNPPWKRIWLHDLIERFIALGESWLLFDADWMHNDHAGQYLKHCSEIVSIGRLQWIPNTTDDGTDNCCWYHFEKDAGPPRLLGRGG